MNITEIKDMIQAVVESGVAELEVQRGENRVRIVRGASYQAVQEIAVPAAAAPQPVAIAAAAAAAPKAVATAPEPAVEEGVKVKSPIVGTFYGSPSPGSPAFVKVGDVVSKGQVLCIVESMKLMNEIESDVSGTILACHVDNGTPVEYGAVLFTVRPN